MITRTHKVKNKMGHPKSTPKYCSACGTSSCPRCHNERLRQQKFCTGCGSDFRTQCLFCRPDTWEAKKLNRSTERNNTSTPFTPFVKSIILSVMIVFVIGSVSSVEPTGSLINLHSLSGAGLFIWGICMYLMNLAKTRHVKLEDPSTGKCFEFDVVMQDSNNLDLFNTRRGLEVLKTCLFPKGDPHFISKSPTKHETRSNRPEPDEESSSEEELIDGVNLKDFSKILDTAFVEVIETSDNKFLADMSGKDKDGMLSFVKELLVEIYPELSKIESEKERNAFIMEKATEKLTEHMKKVCNH